MSSVFGIMTVEGNRISEAGRIILDCFDPDLKEHKIVYSKELSWLVPNSTGSLIVKHLKQ